MPSLFGDRSNEGRSDVPSAVLELDSATSELTRVLVDAREVPGEDVEEVARIANAALEKAAEVRANAETLLSAGRRAKNENERVTMVEELNQVASQVREATAGAWDIAGLPRRVSVLAGQLSSRINISRQLTVAAEAEGVSVQAARDKLDELLGIRDNADQRGREGQWRQSEQVLLDALDEARALEEQLTQAPREARALRGKLADALTRADRVRVLGAEAVACRDRLSAAYTPAVAQETAHEVLRAGQLYSSISSSLLVFNQGLPADAEERLARVGEDLTRAETLLEDILSREEDIARLDHQVAEDHDELAARLAFLSSQGVDNDLVSPLWVEHDALMHLMGVRHNPKQLKVRQDALGERINSLEQLATEQEASHTLGENRSQDVAANMFRDRTSGEPAGSHEVQAARFEELSERSEISKSESGFGDIVELTKQPELISKAEAASESALSLSEQEESSTPDSNFSVERVDPEEQAYSKVSAAVEESGEFEPKDNHPAGEEVEGVAELVEEVPTAPGNEEPSVITGSEGERSWEDLTEPADLGSFTEPPPEQAEPPTRIIGDELSGLQRLLSGLADSRGSNEGRVINGETLEARLERALAALDADLRKER